MPMLDLTIPAGALDPAAEQALVARLTDVLLRWEGADPANAFARSIAWAFVHRPEAVYVGGAPAAAPTYRITASVPEGQLDDRRRAGLVAEVTEAVLDAEAGRFPRDPRRVWVFALEVPDGRWGGAGTVWRLADIAGAALGDREAGRRHAARRLAAVRAERDAAVEAEPAADLAPAAVAPAFA